jgi:leucyl aminopeptidase (aminopeptidase T)
MLSSHVIICPTYLTMYYTDAKQRACQGGARFLSMAGATLAVLSSGAIEADFHKQKPLVERVAKMLTDANEVSLRSAAGTSIAARLVGRRAVAITGMCEKPGESTGVPDIEAYVAPEEDSVQGVAIVDGSISGLALVRTPVKLEIRDGIARRITGGAEATKLRKILSIQKDRAVYQIAEIGLGLNPKARLRGSIVEDESALGTTHLALGDNSKFGGKNPAPVHIDLVLRKSTMDVDGERVPLRLR